MKYRASSHLRCNGVLAGKLRKFFSINYDVLSAKMEPDEVETIAYHSSEVAKLGASTSEKMRVTLKSNADYFVTYSGMLCKGDPSAV